MTQALKRSAGSGILGLSPHNQTLAAAVEASDSIVTLGHTSPLAIEEALLAMSCVSRRARARSDITLRLPQAEDDRETLRRWGFQSAIEGAAGPLLLKLVAPDDQEHFGEPRRPFDCEPLDAGLEALVSRLGADGFFGLTLYELTARGALSRMIRREWHRWRNLVMLELLDSHASGPSKDIARVIVHELLANAIQHPDARTATVATSVESSQEGGNPELVVAIWDDGRSIVETLREFVDKGLRTPDQSNEDDRFALHADGWSTSMSEVLSNWAPAGPVHDGELLLASLFPGISRKAHALGFPHVDRPEPVEWEGRTGFGLYALYKSAIDDFNGSLAIWSNRYVLQLSRSKLDANREYSVVVSRLRGSPLQGNLISVRLPLSQ